MYATFKSRFAPDALGVQSLNLLEWVKWTAGPLDISNLSPLTTMSRQQNESF